MSTLVLAAKAKANKAMGYIQENTQGCTCRKQTIHSRLYDVVSFRVKKRPSWAEEGSEAEIRLIDVILLSRKIREIGVT